MNRRIRRSGACDSAEDGSDDDDEDGFTMLSKKQSKRQRQKFDDDDGYVKDSAVAPDTLDSEGAAAAAAPLLASSSRKRHHTFAGSDTRKQKLDAIVQELSSQTTSVATTSTRGGRQGRGSFVQPGEEHLTTNVFVGNLPPSVTEEEVVQLFGQFGELYSVKIMYPRTTEELSRNRHSGFVCFCQRQDAQDAISACSERDVFSKGHRLQVNWGRRIDMRGQHSATVSSSSNMKAGATRESNCAPAFDLNVHGEMAIQVRPPSDSQRLHLISTVASFIAKDGAQLEQHLVQQYHLNQMPELDFLVYQSRARQASHSNDDHIYYKWRVYSFAQGDSWHTWRVEPFQMVKNGCYWISPPLEVEAARREQEAKRVEEQELDRLKQQRRLQNMKQNLLTGRQLENSQMNKSKELSREDVREFHRLTREELCGSRDSVLQAMSFCFDKSGAADHISFLLKELMLETTNGDDDVDLVTGRLFLLSDVLYNSQQAGVNNAFRYRDAIEHMAPEVFDSLHRYGHKLGRMTLSKLARAIRNVLLAWQEWEVFHAHFIDELRSRFDGQESSGRMDTGEQDSNEKLKSLEAAVLVEPHVGASARTLAFPVGTFENVDGEDLDGEPLDELLSDTREYCPIDGKPLDDDNAYAEDTGDGDEYIDGEPVDGEFIVGSECDLS